MSRPVLHVRFKAGIVGETRRTVHVVPAPDGGAMPEVLVALCGERIFPGMAELVAPFEGMPCERCGRAVITAPLPGDEQVPPALPKREPGSQLSGLLDEMVTIAVEAITAHCDRDGHCPPTFARAGEDLKTGIDALGKLYKIR